MVVFLIYLGKMYKPMQEFSKIMDAYSKADVGYERIQEIMASENEMAMLLARRKLRRSRAG